MYLVFSLFAPRRYKGAPEAAARKTLFEEMKNRGHTFGVFDG